MMKKFDIWVGGWCLGMAMGPIALGLLLYWTGHLKVFGVGTFGVGRLFCIY